MRTQYICSKPSLVEPLPHECVQLFVRALTAFHIFQVVSGATLPFLHYSTVVPVFSGYPWFQAKVSLHCRCPLIRGSQFYNKIWRARVLTNMSTLCTCTYTLPCTAIHKFGTQVTVYWKWEHNIYVVNRALLNHSHTSVFNSSYVPLRRFTYFRSYLAPLSHSFTTTNSADLALPTINSCRYTAARFSVVDPF